MAQGAENLGGASKNEAALVVGGGPARPAENHLYLHRQHRSAWTFQVVLRPLVEKW